MENVSIRLLHEIWIGWMRRSGTVTKSGSGSRTSDPVLKNRFPYRTARDQVRKFRGTTERTENAEKKSRYGEMLTTLCRFSVSPKFITVDSYDSQYS